MPQSLGTFHTAGSAQSREMKLLLLLYLTASSVVAFQSSHRQPIHRSWVDPLASDTILKAVTDSEQSKERAVSSTSSSSGGVNGASTPTGGLVSLSSDAKSQLFSAFTALDLPDQYDAVLTGLCAKILDNTDLKEEQVAPSLQDPLQLLNEMNMKRIRASPRSLMALIDVRDKQTRKLERQ